MEVERENANIEDSSPRSMNAHPGRGGGGVPRGGGGGRGSIRVSSRPQGDGRRGGAVGDASARVEGGAFSVPLRCRGRPPGKLSHTHLEHLRTSYTSALFLEHLRTSYTSALLQTGPRLRSRVALKGEPLAGESACRTDVTMLSWPHDASSAPLVFHTVARPLYSLGRGSHRPHGIRRCGSAASLTTHRV
jgi:hypothetical protein